MSKVYCLKKEVAKCNPKADDEAEGKGEGVMLGSQNINGARRYCNNDKR